MSTHESVEHDERTEAVIGTSCRLAFFFYCLALPVDYAYRAIVRHENAWDLMALYVVGLAILLIYQAREKVLGKAWWVRVASIAAATCITGVVVSAMTQDTVWIMAVTGVVTGVTAAVVHARMARTR